MHYSVRRSMDCTGDFNDGSSTRWKKYQSGEEGYRTGIFDQVLIGTGKRFESSVYVS